MDYETKYNIITEQLNVLKSKLQDEHDESIQRFIRKPIPWCAYEGNIAQEIGWILGELEKILDYNKEEKI